jgi:copper chaperone CopZ
MLHDYRQARQLPATRALKGVTAVRAVYAQKLVRVTFDDTKASPEKVRAAIEKAGFSSPPPKGKK